MRTGQVILCVCRASMRLLVAGDTHARPPRGQTHVHQHAVAVWYFICLAWARPCASAPLGLRLGPGSLCPGRHWVRTIPPSHMPCLPSEAPLVSCYWMTTYDGPCLARHGPTRSSLTALLS